MDVGFIPFDDEDDDDHDIHLLLLEQSFGKPQPFTKAEKVKRVQVLLSV